MSDADASSDGGAGGENGGAAASRDGAAGSGDAAVGSESGTGGESGQLTAARARLEAIRADGDRRRTAQAAGAVVGLVLATLHPVGLVLGGALVALFAADLKRGVAAGAAFGALALVAFAVTLVLGGSLGGFLGLGLPTVVSVAFGLVFPVLGSLVRGVV